MYIQISAGPPKPDRSRRRLNHGGGSAWESQRRRRLNHGGDLPFQFSEPSIRSSFVIARCEFKTIGATWWRRKDGAQGGGAGVMRSGSVVRRSRAWCWWTTRLRPADWRSEGQIGIFTALAISKTSRVSRTVVANSKRNGFENPNSRSSSEHEANATDCSVSDSGEDFVEDVSRRESSLGSEWWFVGCSEVSGLSTCKGRRVKPGDEVVFTGEGFNC
uniref:Uncharacterized protein n=1 Tax=Fagus sylvatica TaxID=28930 RepID=A0A2N9IMA0_FAGSY